MVHEILRFEKWSNLIGWEPFSKYLKNEKSFRHAVFAEISRTLSWMNSKNVRKIICISFRVKYKKPNLWACPGMFGQTRDTMKYIFDFYSIRSTTMQNLGVYTKVVHEILRFAKWSNLIGWEHFSKYLKNEKSFRHAVFAEVSRTKSLMNTENFRKILLPVFEKSAKNHIYRHVRACPGMFGRTRDISKHIYDSFSIRSTIMQNMVVYT